MLQGTLMPQETSHQIHPFILTTVGRLSALTGVDTTRFLASRPITSSNSNNLLSPQMHTTNHKSLENHQKSKLFPGTCAHHRSTTPSTEAHKPDSTGAVLRRRVFLIVIPS